MSPEHRQQTLKQMPNQQYDLLIVGGGITGAGVARDAASRGLKPLLLEMGDFGSGTSSRSSKLVHGGIRYLENFEFSLVFEALSERKTLLEIAPHMVHPMRFTIPIYKTSRVPRWKMALGMWAYDILSLFESPKMHEHLPANQLQVREPTLNEDGLRGGFVYSDAYMDDDLLVTETLRSAVVHGAEVANYVKVKRIIDLDSGGCEVQVVDELSGADLKVRAKHVVSCVGPWTDIFGGQALAQWKPKLRPTKGVHILIPRDRLPVRDAVVMAVEKRIIFVIPRGEMVIIGTTDTDFRENPSEVLVDSDDVAYILSALNRYFPEQNIQKEDLVSCYSGVRPLVADGADSEGKTSREHQIFKPSANITCVAGGKYTTYRAMSEQIVDEVLSHFPFDVKMALGKSKTRELLNPAVSADQLNRLSLQTEKLAKRYNFTETQVQTLIDRYGDDCHQILKLAYTVSLVDTDLSIWMARANFAIENEMCLTLEDFYWRRSGLFLFNKGHGIDMLPVLSEVFAQRLKWDKQYQEAQIKKVKDQITKETAALK